MALSPHELALRAGLRASRQFAGVAVTYSRDASSLSILKAIQGTTRYATLSHTGTEIVVELVDWLIDEVALTLGTPEIGDTITRVLDDASYVYTVEQPEMGLSHWDWSDTGRTQYRIRTRKTSPAPVIDSKPNGYDIRGEEIRYD